MQINNGYNYTYFKSLDPSYQNQQIFPDDKMDDDYFSDCRNELREHYCEYELPYHSIYEKEGRMTEYQFENFKKELAPELKHTSFNSMLSLPLRHIDKIEGLQNSYHGETLHFDSEYDNNEEEYECLETMKQSGIKTYIDLTENGRNKRPIEDAGLNYHSYRSENIFTSNAAKSLKTHLDADRRLYEWANKNGDNIDIEDRLKYSKEYFLENSRSYINQLTNYINLVQQDNVYIGCGFGTQRTSLALLLNDAFNPQCMDKPLNIPELKGIRAEHTSRSAREGYQLQTISRLLNIHEKLTPEDKAKMGWTEETDEKFLKRLNDTQNEIINEDKSEDDITPEEEYVPQVVRRKNRKPRFD